MSGTEVTRRPGRHSLVVSGVAGATAVPVAAYFDRRPAGDQADAVEPLTWSKAAAIR
jgi:hypothetical protein